MSNIEDFLSAEEEQDIIEAIRTAEDHTSGEIRVHIERSSKDETPFERAKEVFHLLKMDNTKLSNGVLLYVAVDDHNFVICGDKGIDAVVPENFWDTTRDAIQSRFKEGNFKQGIIDGILKAGHELKVHFPVEDDDINELPNEISRG
ncbi:TPM domain-containing protein [Mangrovimonas xylaniphaga]|uniref:TPM domain-containing protein n=1 Tax=Mangrovimonas xylaniphaga TaxID=1645915 RepID=UPI0006B3FD92|nr:TPM domain-containing protein [Mangrovimonas xylaniphaga]